MEVNTSTVAMNQIATAPKTQAAPAKEEETAAKAAETTQNAAKETEAAAVYEKSADTQKAEGTVTKKPSQQDRTAIIEQMKADLEARQAQLLDIVKKTMQGQGKAIAQADDVWKFLAEGNFEVDPATRAQAQADIAEDGYWGVNQTSDRMVDFAKALAGDDPAKADKMIEAFKKGYEEATKAWGKDLPDITKQTYDSTLKKLEEWRDSGKTTDTAAQNTADTTAQINAASQAASDVQ